MKRRGSFSHWIDKLKLSFRNLLNSRDFPIPARTTRPNFTLIVSFWLAAGTTQAASSGTVVVWGNNASGQATVPPTAQSGVTAIAAGQYYTLCLKEDGSVVAWGDNTHGQAIVPTAALNSVKAIAAGGKHALALKNDGSLVAWGRNEYGQATVPMSAIDVTAVAAGFTHSVALKSDGSVVVWGDNIFRQRTVPVAAQSGVSAIASGSYHVLALKNDGSVVGWGNNGYGQTNVPAGLNDVKAIAAGLSHNVVLKSDGTVVAWGYNAHGQTNVPAGLRDVVAISAGGNCTLALKKDGTVVAWGYGYHGQTSVPGSLQGTFTSIATGDNHSVGLIGILTPPIIITQPASQEVSVGQNLSLFVTAHGYALSYQWLKDGTNLDGATGATCSLGHARTNHAGRYSVVVSNFLGSVTSAPQAVLTVRPPVAGKVVAWGWPAWSSTNIPIFAQNGVIAITLGYEHALALKSNGTVVAWGNNGYGQTSVPPSLSDVVAIGAGTRDSSALRSDGGVTYWGSRTNADVNAQDGVIAIPTSYLYYDPAVLKANGSVVAWSFLTNVPVAAQNGVTAISMGGAHILALKNDGSVVAWGDNAWGQTTVPFAAQSGVTAIAAGYQHSVAIRTDGSIVAWGAGTTDFGRNPNWGQSIVPPTAQSGVVAISAGIDHTMAVKKDGSIVGWGANYNAQSTAPQYPTGAIGVAAGAYYSMALLSQAAPSISVQPARQFAGRGSKVTLAVEAGGAKPLFYQWRRNGTNLPGMNRETLLLDDANDGDSGTYSLMISNSFGKITSDDARLTIRDTVFSAFNTGVDETHSALPDGIADPHYALIINPDSASSIATVEDSTAFPLAVGPWLTNDTGSKWIGPRINTSQASGGDGTTGNYTYRTLVDLTGFDPDSIVMTGLWAAGDTGIDIQLNGRSTFQPFTSHAGTFTPFNITNGFHAGLNTIDFQVNNAMPGHTGLRVDRFRVLGVALPPGTAPFIVKQPESQVPNFGDVVTLRVRANGSGPLRYTWHLGTNPLPDETNATLVVRYNSRDQIGDYNVIVSNPFGNASSEMVRLGPPNRPPTYAIGTNILVKLDESPLSATIPNWATSISPGDPEETGQALHFELTQLSGSLPFIDRSPAIYPDGTLFFSMPTGGVTPGSATFSLVLRDNGGTTAGGRDASESQSFTITVVPANNRPVAESQNIATTNCNSISITLAASDVEGDQLSFAIVAPPKHGALIGTPPDVVYTPAYGFTGQDAFSFTASDGRHLSAPGNIHITVHPSNYSPAARILTEALVTLAPDFEHPVLLSCNWWNSCLRLDGSESKSQNDCGEESTLSYLWFIDSEPVPFASGAAVTNCFEVGTHLITLVVTDTKNTTGVDTKTFEVVTAPLAVEMLIEKVGESQLSRKTKRELMAVLRIALNRAGRGRLRETQIVLTAFEKKVRGQVISSSPTEAAQWIRWSQEISEGMENCIKPAPKSKYTDHKGSKDTGNSD